MANSGRLKHRAVLDVLEDPAGVMIVVLVVELLLPVRTALSTFTMMTKTPQSNAWGEVNLCAVAQQLGSGDSSVAQACLRTIF